MRRHTWALCGKQASCFVHARTAMVTWRVAGIFNVLKVMSSIDWCASPEESCISFPAAKLAALLVLSIVSPVHSTLRPWKCKSRIQPC